MRLMLLNERIFKNKRLKLRVDDNNVKVVYLLYHRLDLWQVRAAKIARDTVFELFCLAYIYDLPRRVEHNVNAREHRQLICFFKQLLAHLSPHCPYFPQCTRRLRKR